MEENENPTMLEFDSPKDPTFIKVIGVGGGGGNAVKHMYSEGIQGVDFIVCNTDKQALQSNPVPNKIAIGKGLGAGGKAERAKAAALEKADEIREILSHNTQMLFITAGMGGGTGTGAAPVIAEIAKSIDLEDADTPKILVVAIVTMPFSFEGRRRREQAELGIAELRKHVDSILVINNDKLRAFGDMTLTNAFSKADDVLLTAAKGIAEIITVTAYVNVDFQDVNTVMENSGTALMGAGVAKGENRAMEAIKAASSSVLLNDDNIRGAKYVLLYFACNSQHIMSMDEIETVTTYLTELTGPDSEEVIWGMGAFDDLEDDELKITLIATGFEKNHTQLPNQVAYQPAVVAGVLDQPITESVEQPSEVEAKDIDAPVLIHKEEPTPAVSQPQQTPYSSHNDDDEQRYTANDTFKPAQEATNPAIGHKYVLEEAEAQVETAPEEPEFNDDNDGIHLKSEEKRTEEVKPNVNTQPIFNAQPTFNPNPITTQPIEEKPVATVAEPVLSDKATMSRADRIKRMVDLLHNNPNGPEIIEKTMRFTPNEDDYAGSLSSNNDANRVSVDASGAIVSNNSFLFDQPD